MTYKNADAFVREYHLELRRIGLDEETSPSGVMASSTDEDAAQFLSHLRTLPSGATWRDVFPDIPKHWDLNDDETWTYPYRPLGPYDYQSLPCGPAVLICLPLGASDVDLQLMSTEAAREGVIVHGSGFVSIENPDWPDRLAYVVLDVSTTEHQYFAFARWIEQRPGFDLAVYSRPVGTQFAPES